MYTDDYLAYATCNTSVTPIACVTCASMITLPCFVVCLLQCDVGLVIRLCRLRQVVPPKTYQVVSSETRICQVARLQKPVRARASLTVPAARSQPGGEHGRAHDGAIQVAADRRCTIARYARLLQ